MPTPSKRELGPGYTFNYRKGPSQKDGPLVCTHHYVFKTRKNKRYAVDVEQYQYNIYFLKYYPLSHRHSKNRYKILTNDGDAFRIITTCVRIFLDIYSRDELASAGFIGEALVGEDEENTKRFRIYMRSVTTFIGLDKFNHHPSVSASAYFLESRKNAEPDLKEKAEQMFNDFYVMPRLFPDKENKIPPFAATG